MTHPFLQVTFRRGRPFAAYDYVSGRSGRKSFKSRRIEPGLVVDYARNGHAIWIEITSPGTVTLTALNRVLRELGAAPLKRSEFEPLRAAS